MRSELALFLVWMSSAAHAGENLDAARQSYKNGDLASAYRQYQAIDSRSADFADKLTDLIRHQLIQKRPLSAFQLVEVARRMELPIKDLDLMRATIMAQARLCAAEYSVDNHAAKLLLVANALRFSNRYRNRSYNAEPFSRASIGRRQNHLAPSQMHSLFDLSKIRLIPGQGCPVFSSLYLEDRSGIQQHELEVLEEWYLLNTDYGTDSSQSKLAAPGSESVVIRLLDLAIEENAKDLATLLLDQYQKSDVQKWINLPFAEGRFLWQALIDKNLVAAPPYRPGQKEFEIAQQVFLSNRHIDYARWLALLDWSTVPAQQREKILEHLIGLDSSERRGRAMILRAQLYAARGEIVNALGLIRELLISASEPVDSDTEVLAISIAADIFTEYRADPTLRSAVQNSLPPSYWPRVFRPALVDEALRGNKKSFDGIIASLKKANKLRSVQLNDEQFDILDAFKDRQLAKFIKIIRPWREARRLGQMHLNFIALLAERVGRLSERSQTALSPFLYEISDLLRDFIEKGQNDGRMQALLAAFPKRPDQDFSKAAETVQQGNVDAGVVDLREATTIPIGLEWGTASRPPTRELIMMPVDATGREWHIP
jgi:hypothetical protein